MVLMMMILALPATIEITVAPDQPMPFVYVDDPLIIEFLSDEEMQVEATMALQFASSSERLEINLGHLHLRPQAAYWHAVTEAPRERGCYTAEFSLGTGENAQRSTARFCRIDRPSSLGELPIYAHCSGGRNSCALTAIRSVGIQTVHFDIANENLNVLADDATLLGHHLILEMNAKQTAQLNENISTVIEDRCENIVRFDVNCNSVSGNVKTAIESLRQEGCPAGISLTVSSPTDFENILANNPGLTVKHVTLSPLQWPDPESVRQLHGIAARNGYEGWQVHVAGLNWRPRENDNAVEFIHRFMRYRAAGAHTIGMNASVIADDVGVQEMLAYLNGLALRYHGQDYVGMLADDNAVCAPVFRSATSWLAVFWSKSSSVEIQFPLDGAVNIALTDALGNSVSAPEINNGIATLSVNPTPYYMSGSGGVLLGQVATAHARRLASSFGSASDMSETLPPELMELIKKIEVEPRDAGSRLRYLELLRMLPVIEEQWHAKKLPKNIAVPAIMGISNLARTLCLVEEDRAELFIEPLSDTLARTEELQSLYLTGSAGSAQARERGDWILGEVRRLIDEAEALDAGGRKIEACAVAALAEWRAKCLKFAANATPSTDTGAEVKPILSVPVPPSTSSSPTDAVPAEAAPTDEISPKGTEAPEPEVSRDDKASADTDADKNDEKGIEDAASADRPYKEIIHRVVSGDNPYVISKKYNVSLDDLLKWNNLTRKSKLHIGQKLIVQVKP